MDDAGPATGSAGLATPLAGGAPAGPDLRQDFSPQSLYYRLRDARAEAREIERRADNDPTADSGVPTQWRTVRDLSIKALSEQTKDLEIAAWLTEALVRLDGMPGLAAGSALIADLAMGLWESGLHPQPDEDGIETQVAPVTGLNGQGNDGTLMQPLRKCVLFPGPDGEPVTYWQYMQSEELETITDAARRKQRLAAKVLPLADVAGAARQAGGVRLSALRSEVKGALAAWTRMNEVLEEKAGSNAPPTSRVRDLLSAIVSVANAYAPPEPDAPADHEATDQGGTGGMDVDGHAAVAGPVVQAARPITREDMLRELERIADFFRRTEPHSPLAYTLEEAVRRGRLTWPELLTEVVPDANVRGAMLVMLGIRPVPPEG
ncbi:MAG: type secretion system protein ImpA [Acetobacteraceae bacterium]|jgi:type VI secretion system protein ImpA|nr:Type secretion protein ImpA [Rhodopila sp.]MEA2733091.1 type secretion system protein ImpA [Acetobacteraceae bacterium]